MSNPLAKRIDLLLGLVLPPAEDSSSDRSGHPSSPMFRAPSDEPPRPPPVASTGSPFRSPVSPRARRRTDPYGEPYDPWTA